MHAPVRVSKPIKLPNDLIELARLFKAAGTPLYVVGGAVRDAIQGKQPKDYDVASAASPQRVRSIMTDQDGFKILELGEAFGIVKVITPLKNEYEIATFRRDIGTGRRPDAVEFTTIEEDVLRRDLTINALFYDIDAEEVVDYVGGLSDIENKVVRAVGDAATRFAEDHLRKLRVIRFAARMGGALDDETAQALRIDPSLTGVSPERIRDEFLKCVESARSITELLRMIRVFDMGQHVFPGLVMTGACVDTRNVPVLLAYLLETNDPNLVAKVMNALKYTSDEIAQVTFLLRFRELNIENAYKLKKQFANSKLRYGDLVEAARVLNLNLKMLAAFMNFELTVSGDELLAQGFLGKDLGAEMLRRETESFRALLR